MQETSFIQESWNIKRIILTLAVLFILGGVVYGLKVFVLDENKVSQKQSSNNSVAGISIQKEQASEEPEDKIDLKSIFPSSAKELQVNIQQKLDAVKEEVNNLNAQDIASSSPQVQKVLNDIKNLEQYPKNQVKEACQKICDGF